MSHITKLTNEESLSPLCDNPKVSILVVCKNGARTIRHCLEGILAQTYPLVEVVFQDGGSTDDTLAIVKGYIDLYPGRIRLREEPDSCAEEGFFRGLKACEGDIIGVACADEELLPMAVAWGVVQLRNHPRAGAVYGDVYVTDLEGNITETWIGRPFSLRGYLCREVDPPFAASFFRREALVGAGLFTRNWTFGIGEFEFWLRVGMKYPVRHVPSVVAKYAFHPNTASYGQFLNDEHFVAVREAFFDRFFAETDLPEAIRGMKEQATAGLRLFIGNTLLNLEVYSRAKMHIEKALEYMQDGSRLLELSVKLSKAGLDLDFSYAYRMLRELILDQIANLPSQRIICYGAGNDFLKLISSGVFAGHNVVAVVDNFRRTGELVGDVPVIPEIGLGGIDHDLVVVTSSKWAREFRIAATHWSIHNPPYIPVI